MIFDRYSGRIRLGLFLGFNLVFYTSGALNPAFCQHAPNLPAQVNPGLMTPNPANIPLREQLRKEEQRPVSEESPQDEVHIDVPDPPTIVELDGSRIQVDALLVEGNTLIDTKTLAPILAPYQGRELDLNELGQVVDQINEQYRQRGYYTSIAYIPPQDITQGVITIRVLEGQVGEVSIAGNQYYRTGIIARYLDQGTDDPLSIPELEKNLRRINRQGNFRVRATLSPHEAPGKTNIRLDVEERQPWQIGLTADNQGRPTIGTLRWGTELINRNVTGIGDRFMARWLGAAGTQTVLGTYFVPLHRSGTELGATFGFTRVNVDLPRIKDDNRIIGNAFNYGLLLTQPLDREHRFVADVGFNARQVASFFNGQRDGATQDNIRSLQVGLNYDRFDHWGRTFARVQSTVGMSWMGGNRSFWKSEALLNRMVRLPKNNLLILRSYGQWTPDALPPAEQFQLGGAYSVRGYTEGLLIGDRGYQVSIEHRWPVPGLRLLSPWAADRVQGAFFADYGRIWMDRNNQRTRIIGNANSLTGVGVGMRAYLTQYMQGFIDFGFGLQNRSNVEPNAQPTVRVHFGVRTDLLPDDYRVRSERVSVVNVKPRHAQEASAIDAARTINFPAMKQ